MNPTAAVNKPANWQVTATTLECDYVREFVTIMVNKDWSCKCVWWSQYLKNKDSNRTSSSKGKQKAVGCQGPDCKYIQQYCDKLLNEENPNRG